MKPMIFPVLILLLYSACSSAEPASESPLSKIDWLIGDWTFVDEEIGGDYRETGTRSCRYAVNDSHIKCVSKGRTGTGPEREYIWYFNFNDRENRYEGFGFFSNYPRKQLYELTISDDGHTLGLAYYSWEAEGVISDGQAQVRYNGSDQYIWDGLNGEPDPETGAPTVSYRDKVTRVHSQ